MLFINYYPLDRSGCSLKRDSLINPNRLYASETKFGVEVIELFCGFKSATSITALFQLFVVNHEIDYNSFNSLN